MVRDEMTMKQGLSILDGDHWVDLAARELASLGFELEEPNRASGKSAYHLLVAIRPAPTLKHFDPEEIACWVTEADRGRAARIDRDSRLPIDTPFAWGRIGITDRLGLSNQFLSFGGRLRAAATPDATILVCFGSPAPILRWSGHSQGIDPLTEQVGAFFARVKVPIDFIPGAEAQVSNASPLTLYCAFIQSVRERLARARGFRDANRGLAEWSSRESQRMQADEPDAWQAASELMSQLGHLKGIARG
jgi:hypothetical protein